MLEPGDQHARPCGTGIDFRMPITPGRVKNWNKAPNVIPFLEMDWNTSIESRRLFFMIGYCWEMGVAEQQLRWIYHADFMPWEFIHAESRHMWDESRHGNSGYTRLRNFGLDFEHFGYSSYGVSGEGKLAPMTPRDVYEAFYGVTQIAETGYFATKRYCFEDFANHGDDASAEMMQYDIIDETSHVEYGRLWLEEMAHRAGVQEDYHKRGALERSSAQKKSTERVEMMRKIMGGYEPPPAPAAPAHGGECVNPGSIPAVEELRNPRSYAHYSMAAQRTAWTASAERCQQRAATAEFTNVKMRGLLSKKRDADCDQIPTNYRAAVDRKSITQHRNLPSNSSGILVGGAYLNRCECFEKSSSRELVRSRRMPSQRTSNHIILTAGEGYAQFQAC